MEIQQTKALSGLAAAAAGWLLARLGIFAPWFGTLLLAMLADYLTGIVSAAYLGRLSSQVGLRGILKKAGYWLLVAASLIADWALLQGGALLGVEVFPQGAVALATTLWLILNEVLSILENLGEMGVALPGFLTRAIESLRQRVDQLDPSLKNLPGQAASSAQDGEAQGEKPQEEEAQDAPSQEAQEGEAQDTPGPTLPGGQL